MEATVGDIAIANDMEIDLVSRFMNRKMSKGSDVWLLLNRSGLIFQLP